MNLPVPSLIEVGDLPRSQYIGGSDIAAIMGVSPWKTPLQLYEQKINPVTEEVPASKAAIFARGHRWEPVARDMLLDRMEDIHGVRPALLNVNARYRPIAKPWAAAEVDCEMVLLDGDLINGELKTVHPFRAFEWGEEATDEVPVHYVAQAMWGLGITGRDTCVVGALFGADTMVPFEIKRDQELIDAMFEKAAKFWFDHVLKRVPPEPINMEDVMRLHRHTNGTPATVTSTMLANLRKLNELRIKVKVAEGEAKDIEYAICMEILQQWGQEAANSDLVDNAILLLDGQQIASWKKQRGASLDQKKLKEDDPDLVARYTKEHWYRAIKFKKGAI